MLVMVNPLTYRDRAMVTRLAERGENLDPDRLRGMDKSQATDRAEARVVGPGCQLATGERR
jgi:hypothetical protein